MIYVPIWGALLLGERFTILGVAGILLVIFGTFLVQMRAIGYAELARPFRDLGSPSVRAALLAGFIYSIGSIAEKTGVRHYSPFYFTYFMILSMLLLMSINLARPKYRSLIAEESRENWRRILRSGPVVMASFLTFRYGLNRAPVGYAVPVRQVSIMTGVVIGIVILRESFGRIRLASARFNSGRCGPDKVRIELSLQSTGLGHKKARQSSAGGPHFVPLSTKRNSHKEFHSSAGTPHSLTLSSPLVQHRRGHSADPLCKISHIFGDVANYLVTLLAYCTAKTGNVPAAFLPGLWC